jgi:hypothetical protein
MTPEITPDARPDPDEARPARIWYATDGTKRAWVYHRLTNCENAQAAVRRLQNLGYEVRRGCPPGASPTEDPRSARRNRAA